ncbi:MAG: hypothetical protein Q7U47_14540, partial [Paludibacter sp.]|nr:hypothetical protein [Paludibacter sp.]
MEKNGTRIKRIKRINPDSVRLSVRLSSGRSLTPKSIGRIFIPINRNDLRLLILTPIIMKLL